MRKYLAENVFIVKREELGKFLPMFLIGSLVIFNFIMLRQLKDALLLTHMGSSAIPRAKIWYVLPSSIFFMFLYNKLSNYMDGRGIFQVFVSLFGLAFLTYTLFFFDSKEEVVSYLFYALAESWSTVVFGTCMWAFFNDICTIDEAKRFYVLISGAQIGAIVGSSSASWLVRVFGEHGFVQPAMFSLVLTCSLIIFSLNFFKSSFVNIRRDADVDNRRGKKDYKGIFKGILLVFRSRYLFLILFITLSYNFTIVVTEYIWKSNVAMEYVSKGDKFVFFGNVSFWTNIVSSILAIFLTGGLMRYVGIVVALVLFPAVFGLSTTVYFFLYMTPVGGAIQWIITKISKYAFADPAKQMLYIPCSAEERYKAKSLVDMVGARGGKALASFFNMAVLAPIVSFSSMAMAAYPYLIVITVLWLISAVEVGRMFIKHKKDQEEALNEA
ncbi:MAG TPA: hypothetical protein DEP20_01510 [Fusobacteria bacterium]|nr:hypothetical protein [Fusobacteriota bacterium]|tara:strand:+ start:2840 stop:4162 length:1323 start_codon:yes stop_codon:yes gene_type:complete